MRVIKMNGESEPLDYLKIDRQVRFACAGTKASPSLLVMRSNLQIKDGMHTSRIQDILIRTAIDLIDEDNPDFAIVASRLKSHKIRKFAYGHYTPPSLFDHIKHCVSIGKYDPLILQEWNEDEINYINRHLDHQRDNDFEIAGMNQFIGKYLMRQVKEDESTIIETPQFVYALVAMCLLGPKDLDKVVRTYNTFSTLKVSLPTPIMAGVRSPSRQYSSCVLIDVGDSLDSISEGARGIVKYVSERAGIGINMGRIRGIGANIGFGEKRHTGLLPFVKHMMSGLKSCSQGGVRGGSGTAYFPMWHWEIQDILTWKNNRGTDEQRARKIDYGIQINDTMIELLGNDDFIYLFDPNHKDLYESYFRSKEEFEVAYNNLKIQADAGLVRSKKIRARDLWTEFVDARFETGRYYPLFVNNANNFSPFGDAYPIYMSNLCAEIALPTRPAESETDENGLVSLCTLMSINMAKFDTIEKIENELPETISLCVELLDSLLSYQNYPLKHSERATLLFRSLGIGVVNLANFLARNKCRYGSKKALELVNKFWATMYYYGKKKSIELARDLGPCGASAELQPFVHQRHEDATNLKERLGVGLLEDEFDWDGLQEMYEQHGIRNATLFAVAPTETSSQLLNATNGVEMPRSIISIKGSKDSISKQVIPDVHLADEYDFLWDQKSPRPYIDTIAVISRWCDQSISTNTPYNPKLFENGKIPRSVLIDDLIYGWSLGLKTFYYNVINDNSGEKKVETKVEDDPCGGACVI